MWLDNESRRERYIRLLSTKMRELQRKPTSAEMRADPMMPSPNDYAFYWGSFDEAVEEIWLKVRRQIAEEGGVCMAKTPKEWPHTADELLELAVAKCAEMGRMPSRRAWLRDQFLDYEEIVAVLGKGDWKRAELKIALAWDHRKGKAEEVVAEKVEPPKAEEVAVEKVESPKNEPPEKESSQEEIVVQQEVKEQMEIKRQRKRYSLEELKAGMTRVQEHFGITVIPTQGQINQAAREIGTPSYTAFLHGLGPKQGWSEVINSGDEAAKADTPTGEMPTVEESASPEPEKAVSEEVTPKEVSLEMPVPEERVDDPVHEGVATCTLVVCAAQLDVILNGQKMRLQIEFGKE